MCMFAIIALNYKYNYSLLWCPTTECSMTWVSLTQASFSTESVHVITYSSENIICKECLLYNDEVNRTQACIHAHVHTISHNIESSVQHFLLSRLPSCIMSTLCRSKPWIIMKLCQNCLDHCHCVRICILSCQLEAQEYWSSSQELARACSLEVVPCSRICSCACNLWRFLCGQSSQEHGAGMHYSWTFSWHP